MINRIISMGDLHLGHPKVPTANIIDRLYEYVFPLLPETDLLCINGDVTESVLSATTTALKLVLSFFIELFQMCEKHNVVIRLLRGTGTHDRNQIETIMKIYTASKYRNDVKYFDLLSIEYIEALNLRMVYIPEDIPFNSSEEIIGAIKTLFQNAGWDKCNLVMFHGYFEHKIPQGVTIKHKIVFRANQFESLVSKDGYILCNHVHTPSLYKNVLYSGSFDRLAHDEEEKKGFFYISDKARFVHNEKATPFYTINLSTMTNKDDIITEFKRQVNNKFQPNVFGYVRFIHPNVEIRQIISRINSLNFPYLHYTHMSKNSNQTGRITDEVLSIDEFSDTVVTEENLPNLLYQLLQEKNDTSLTLEEITALLT